MKVYITQYALTKGIFETDVTSTHSETMVTQPKIGGQCFHKPYWHIKYEDAIIHAEKMKNERLKSLRKQIEKTEKIKFI